MFEFDVCALQIPLGFKRKRGRPVNTTEALQDQPGEGNHYYNDLGNNEDENSDDENNDNQPPAAKRSRGRPKKINV